MGALNRCWILFLVAIWVAVLPRPGEAGPFIAYSMKEAEGRLKRSGRSAPEVLEMGGITRIAGMVYDPSHGDLIVIGQANAGEEKTSLDDFVVAIRAMGIHKAWPLVSIDKTAETQATGRQVVRFEGGIASSPLGRDLLAADVILKKIALRLLPSDIWECPWKAGTSPGPRRPPWKRDPWRGPLPWNRKGSGPM